MSSAAERRQRCYLPNNGTLPDEFLRIGPSQSEIDAQVAQALYQQQFSAAGGGAQGAIPQGTTGRLSITVVQAKLAKNYSYLKMDPYCRIRIGHSVFETPTDHNGGKNPRWHKTVQCYVNPGITSVYVEIFDEKTFTMDDRIAWAHVTIPETVCQGETSDDWHTLNGKQGDDKEGMINLVFTHAVVNAAPVVFPQPVMIMNPAPAFYGPGYTLGPQMVPVGPAYAAPGAQPQQQPARERCEDYTATEEDVNQVLEMFPDMDIEVVKSVLESAGGNKEATIGALLQMQEN